MKKEIKDVELDMEVINKPDVTSSQEEIKEEKGFK